MMRQRGIHVAKAVLWCLGAIALLGVAAQPAAAVPDLQLYVDGAVYDTESESWVITANEFDIQVIGANNNVADVKLAAALVPSTTDPSSGSVTLTPVGFSSGPQTPFVYGTPIMGDGSPLPPHGIYPSWYTTLPVGDFEPLYTVYNMQPDETGSALGQIKSVHVSITGFSAVHFDAYDHTINGHERVRFAPFSHDVEYTPEPGTVALFTLGIGAVLGVRARGRRGRSKE